MSALYGTLQGSRGEATRCGTKKSGLTTAAQSYDGSVITRLTYDSDKLNIRIDLADDSRSSMGDTYFRGTLEELKECFKNYKQLKETSNQ